MGLFDNLKRWFGGEPPKRPAMPGLKFGLPPPGTSLPVRPAAPAPQPPRPAANPSPPPPRAPVRLEGLDAHPFEPLADADVKREARSAGDLFRNAWFGRRDLIPPVEDPRTLLIDRAMTAHGFLTP